MKKFLGSFSAIAVMLFACNSARATLFTVTTTGPNGTSTQTIASSSGTTTTLPDGVTQEWKGTATSAGSYTMQWDLLLDPDPSISGSIALTNASASTQTFTLNVSQAVSPTVASGANIIGSSALSVSDANGDGSATMAAPTGSAIYTAFINSPTPGTNVGTIFAAPFTLAESGPGGVNVASNSIVAGSHTSVAVTQMGIQHSFTLTSGDSATTNSTFTLTVPEPCTLALAAIGGLGLVAVRRSRRK